MAEAIARYDAADVIDASSAGLRPLGFIPDLTKHTLAGKGYSADGLTSDRMTAAACDAADIVINMSGQPWEESLPNQEKVEDWMVRDPYGMDAGTYLRVFEGIQRRVGHLAEGLRTKRQNRRAGK
jgi:protein-tyrosine-phosphatase